MSDLSLLVQMGLGALLALSVYLPLRCGQLSLATPGFYAIGGYVAALLSTRWPALAAAGAGGLYPLPALLLEMVLAVGLAVGLALLIGRPVLKLRGIYLAIATIALVEILRVVNLNAGWSGGAVGIFAIPQPFDGPGGYLVCTALLLALCCWFCARLEQTRLGRAMAAIREDELATRCMGVPTAQVALSAFVLSAAIAALTGVVAAHFLNTWNARQGGFDASITTLAFVVFGGSRTWLGPVLGGLVLTALPELLRPVGDLRLIVFGLVILVGSILAPQGLITPERLAALARAFPARAAGGNGVRR
ncbi:MULTISPECIES: branched-chain amino acid ABC transporter permease [unclassified Synechococcus]|uniref:branched-chain amino acid ABC transporter permease n=1 Tax=unclassified Synechococcus TaxID=2626047 RepID=UPI0021A36047|nr:MULTISPECIES: branched-chain amino acid ABC transporter permease [unclassified Synechococcus]